MTGKAEGPERLLGLGVAIVVPALVYRIFTHQFNLTTGLVFLASLALTVMLSAEVAMRRRGTAPARKNRLRQAVAALVLFGVVSINWRWGALPGWVALASVAMAAAAGIASVARLVEGQRVPAAAERVQRLLARARARAVAPLLALARGQRADVTREAASARVDPERALAGARVFAWFDASAPLVKQGLLLASASLAVAGGLRVHQGQLDSKTAACVLLAACLVATLAAEAVLFLLKAESALRVNIRLLLVTSLVLVLGLEVGLRIATDRYHTYSEVNHGRYQSVFQPEERGWFHVYQTDSVTFVKSEFTHRRNVNSLGLTDGEIDLQKAPGEFRLLALGDSFTEGVGTAADSTWVRVTEKHLGAITGRPVRAYNAGISGSDVCFEYVLFQEKLEPFRPDLVVVAVNTSDVGDFLVRGGMERFRSDGTLSFHPAPRWEPVYAVSYLSRAIVRDLLGYDHLFIPLDRQASQQRSAVDEIGTAVRALQSLCSRRGAKLLIVAHPMEFEVNHGRYLYEDFSRLVGEWKSGGGHAVLDLLDVYGRQGLINKENAGEFFWKLDLHHNTRGYAVMGGAIATGILELGLLDASKDSAYGSSPASSGASNSALTMPEASEMRVTTPPRLGTPSNSNRTW
jgi:lysophospholipase L1-like esterase